MAQSDEEQEALLQLLDANGLTEEDIQGTGAQQITHLEMFLHEYPKMLGLQNFPALKTLCLTHQGIKEVSGLDQCVNLEKLWVVENEIKAIKGLGCLTKLKELYLYSNQITRMENLSHLSNLEVLWLADNYIPSIAEVDSMPRLRELNLARNDIAVVGDALQHNTALEVLNLADNAIGSFKEVKPLTRLPYLTDLCFADPMWGECPMSGLCNYQTYVLFMLPNLATLDTLLLAEETKQLAEATFLKKQMYYNMRVKTVHRNARNIIKLAAEGKKLKLSHHQPLLLKLAAHQRELQRELNEAKHYIQAVGEGSSTKRVSGGGVDALKQNVDAIQSLIDTHNQQAGEMEAEFEACAVRTYQVVDGHIKNMMLEFDSAGNIRLEEGQPTDAWYTSCVDLCMSRFNPADYDASLGVTGINILGVTRVHNRWLRNRFEKQVAQLGDTTDGSKRAMEYLFLGEHPALPSQLGCAVEAGVQHPSAMAALGLDAAVVLSNSLLLADRLRLQAALEAVTAQKAASQVHGSSSNQAKQSMGPIGTGRLMIVKAYLGNTAMDSTAIQNNRLSSSKNSNVWNADGQLVPTALLDGPRVDRRMHPASIDSVYRCYPGDSKQRLWYLFDNALVLPEYIVEFQYQAAPGGRLATAHTASMTGGPALSSESTTNILNGLEPDLRPLARPLLSWLAYHFDSSLFNQLGNQGLDESKVASLLEQQPGVAPSAKLQSITVENLKRHTQCEVLDQLTYLSLHNCGLRKMEGLSSLKKLQVLVLSFNEFTRIEGLSELGGLQHLDVAYNNIKKVDGLKGLTSLQHLNMSYNQVSKLEEIYGLKKYVSQLTYLDMSGNPLCEDKSYRPTVLRKMAYLSHLDGRPVCAAESAVYGDHSGALSLPMILEAGSAGDRAVAAATGGLAPAQIQELVLERRHIRRLQNLSGLTHVRRMSFADNQVSHIEGLESCTACEELCLEDNRIGSIEGLQGLTRLKKLQLGRNRLVGLEPLSTVTGLTQLSVEDNELTSLAGLESLPCLMELYAGNNRLHDLREVQRLRVLPKLIILDLSGNPCTATSVDDYRLYVIFNVRKLKVLDGVPIDAIEQAAAKSKYAGRLTLDFLEERLGHRMFDRIRDLDMSSLKIRDVGSVFMREELECLQEINLDNNLLTEVSGLALLRQLVVLQLNGNRLGEECNFNPRHMLERNQELYKAWLNVCRRRSQGQGQVATPPSLELFPCLQALQLGSNQISSISALQLGGLTSLRTLFLNNNEITRIDGLEGLYNLQELILDRNRIRHIDAEALAGLSRLRELRLEDNGLRTLANLHTLTSVQSLHLGNNRISELQELDKLTCLTGLVEISLVNNPLTRKQGYRVQLISRLPKLYSADNQVITLEEREHANGVFNAQSLPFPLGLDILANPNLTPSPNKAGQAIRLTNLDFAGLAAAASQYSQVPVAAMPTIPSNVMMMNGPGALGLEGVGIRDGQPPGSKEQGAGIMIMGYGQAASPGATGYEQGSFDVFGRPMSTDKRGAALQRMMAAAGAGGGRPAAMDLGGSPGLIGVGRGAGGGSMSGVPSRRQALLGRGGYRSHN